MVCKDCTASNLTQVMVDASQRGFHVWCFGTGDIVNHVSLARSSFLTVSILRHQSFVSE